jgi:predicted ATPase
MSKPNVLAEPVLVGREKELEELESFLDSAIEGKGKTVFVTGEAGSGKTRLIREFLEVAKTRGVGVMAGWCLSDTQAPYFPFVEALNSYSDSGTGQEPESLNKSDLPLNAPISFHAMPEEYGIAAWLTSTEAAPKLGKPELSPQVWKDQVFAGVAKTLHGIAIQEPVIIFIDDVHWADSASLALMHYLARAIQDSERVLLLATYRTEELTSDEEGHPHPLAEIMRLMRREELFTEINLAGFDQQNVSKIATNMIGGSLQLKFAEELSAESNGNPLFIVESLRMLNERKSLIQENKEWRLAVDELGIPNKIKDIILRRLACLKYAQRRVLDAASVIGEEFDVDLLSTVLGQDYLEILETLNVVAHSTSLVRVYGNHYRFDHARSRDTLYEELAMPLKRGYHNKIAEKLESTRDQAMCLSDIAYHYVQAENKEKSLKFSLAAGQEALAKWSNTQAAQHFQYVLRTIGESPNRLSEKAAALEGLGDAYYANNNFNEAAMAFEQVADIQTGVAKLRALRKAMFAAFYLGDTPLLVRLTQKADENATADRLESARVLHQKARAILMQLDAYTCQKMLEEVLKVFEEEYALSDAAWILFANASNTARLKGEFERGVEMALRSIALYDELGDVRSQLEAYLYTAFTFEACALREDAERMYAKIVEVNEQYKM